MAFGFPSPHKVLQRGHPVLQPCTHLKVPSTTPTVPRFGTGPWLRTQALDTLDTRTRLCQATRCSSYPHQSAQQVSAPKSWVWELDTAYCKRSSGGHCRTSPCSSTQSSQNPAPPVVGSWLSAQGFSSNWTLWLSAQDCCRATGHSSYPHKSIQASGHSCSP